MKLTLTRHGDHDPSLTCRPALGYGLCEVLEPDDDGDGPEMAAQAAGEAA